MTTFLIIVSSGLLGSLITGAYLFFRAVVPMISDIMGEY